MVGGKSLPSGVVNYDPFPRYVVGTASRSESPGIIALLERPLKARWWPRTKGLFRQCC